MTIYQQYAALRQQQDAIAQEIAHLNEKILLEVTTEHNYKLENEFGTFQAVRGKDKWRYSEEYLSKEVVIKAKIKAVNEKLKALQVEDQQSGKATKIQDGLYLKYMPNKEVA